MKKIQMIHILFSGTIQEIIIFGNDRPFYDKNKESTKSCYGYEIASSNIISLKILQGTSYKKSFNGKKLGQI